MGRQINYYMEVDSYKLLVKKALELDFKVIDRLSNFKIYSYFEEVNFSKNELYFYLEEAGGLIVKENGFIDTLSSPIVESGFSYINDNKKEVSTARLWVSTGFWNNESEFIGRSEILDKKYSSLMRFVKKVAPYTEIKVKARNPLYNGKKFVRKEYITPFLLEKAKSGEYDCI